MRPIRPPPKVNPPKPPAYLFEPAQSQFNGVNSRPPLDYNPVGPPDASPVVNDRREDFHPPSSRSETSMRNPSQPIDFDKDVEMEMRAIEENIRQMLAQSQSLDNKSTSSTTQQQRQQQQVAYPQQYPPQQSLSSRDPQGVPPPGKLMYSASPMQPSYGGYNSGNSGTGGGGMQSAYANYPSSSRGPNGGMPVQPSPRNVDSAAMPSYESSRNGPDLLPQYRSNVQDVNIPSQPSPQGQARIRQNQSKGEEQGGGLVFGLDKQSERELKRKKQEEYRRQLDQLVQQNPPPSNSKLRGGRRAVEEEDIQRPAAVDPKRYASQPHPRPAAGPAGPSPGGRVYPEEDYGRNSNRRDAHPSSEVFIEEEKRRRRESQEAYRLQLDAQRDPRDSIGKSSMGGNNNDRLQPQQQQPPRQQQQNEQPAYFASPRGGPPGKYDKRQAQEEYRRLLDKDKLQQPSQSETVPPGYVPTSYEPSKQRDMSRGYDAERGRGVGGGEEMNRPQIDPEVAYRRQKQEEYRRMLDVDKASQPEVRNVGQRKSQNEGDRGEYVQQRSHGSNQYTSSASSMGGYMPESHHEPPNSLAGYGNQSRSYAEPSVPSRNDRFDPFRLPPPPAGQAVDNWQDEEARMRKRVEQDSYRSYLDQQMVEKNQMMDRRRDRDRDEASTVSSTGPAYQQQSAPAAVPAGAAGRRVVASHVAEDNDRRRQTQLEYKRLLDIQLAERELEKEKEKMQEKMEAEQSQPQQKQQPTPQKLADPDHRHHQQQQQHPSQSSQYNQPRGPPPDVRPAAVDNNYPSEPMMRGGYSDYDRDSTDGNNSSNYMDHRRDGGGYGYGASHASRYGHEVEADPRYRSNGYPASDYPPRQQEYGYNDPSYDDAVNRVNPSSMGGHNGGGQQLPPPQQPSPGKSPKIARARLVTDIYGQSALLGGDSAAPVDEKWRPSGKNLNERQKNAIADQKSALAQQIEENRLRKLEEEKKEKELREKEDEKIRKEIAKEEERQRMEREKKQQLAGQQARDLADLQAKHEREALARKNRAVNEDGNHSAGTTPAAAKHSPPRKNKQHDPPPPVLNTNQQSYLRHQHQHLEAATAEVASSPLRDLVQQSDEQHRALRAGGGGGGGYGARAADSYYDDRSSGRGYHVEDNELWRRSPQKLNSPDAVDNFMQRYQQQHQPPSRPMDDVDDDRASYYPKSRVAPAADSRYRSAAGGGGGYGKPPVDHALRRPRPEMGLEDIHEEEEAQNLSFVSESRLVPNNPWSSSDLLSNLVPLGHSANNNHEGSLGRKPIATHRQQQQRPHQSALGGEDLERSLASNSLLTYVGSRTPMGTFFDHDNSMQSQKRTVSVPSTSVQYNDNNAYSSAQSQQQRPQSRSRLNPESLPAAGRPSQKAAPMEDGVEVAQMKRVIQQSVPPSVDEVPANRIFLRSASSRGNSESDQSNLAPSSAFYGDAPSGSSQRRNNAQDTNNAFYEPPNRVEDRPRPHSGYTVETASNVVNVNLQRPPSGRSVGSRPPSSSSIASNIAAPRGRSWGLSKEEQEETIRQLAQHSVASIISTSSAGNSRLAYGRRDDHEESYASEGFDG